MRGGRTPDQLGRISAVDEDTLGRLLAVPADDADAAARDLLHDAVGLDVESLTMEPVGYSSGSPTTGGLYRLRGSGAAGSASLFCKVVHHVRHWPGLAMLPETARDSFAAELPWRTELELWDPLVQASLPDGLRSPILHRMLDLGDDRIAAWQEDVTGATGTWTTSELAGAAALLGRWNARCTEPAMLATSPYPPGYALRMYATRAVAYRGLVPLADDDLWSHPWLREHADLRADLLALGPQIPAMLDRLDTLPQALPHGDASPQNLLRAADGIVVIDLSFRTSHALGFDLGQLLVGLVHAGELPARRLPEIAAAILPAYVDGVHATGTDVPTEHVPEAFATSVLLRSAFDGFLYDLLDQGEGARHAFDERVRMSRFLVDQHAAVTGAG